MRGEARGEDGVLVLAGLLGTELVGRLLGELEAGLAEGLPALFAGTVFHVLVCKYAIFIVR